MRLPSAQSVPRTAMRGVASFRISPVQKCSSLRSFTFRTSVIVRPFLSARRASSGSSDANSWSPLTTDRPFSRASRSAARISGVIRPPCVAIPTIA